MGNEIMCAAADSDEDDCSAVANGVTAEIISIQTLEEGTEAIRKALDSGADVADIMYESPYGPRKYQALSLAQYRCPPDDVFNAMELLIERGAEVNPSDGSVSSLASAIRAHQKTPQLQEQVVRYLIGQGADVNADLTRCGWTSPSVLHFAVKHRNRLPMVRMLLDAGAQACVCCEVLGTCLTEAMRWHFGDPSEDLPALIQTLLDAGVDPLVKCGFGINALGHLASHTEVPTYWEAVTLLLDATHAARETTRPETSRLRLQDDA